MQTVLNVFKQNIGDAGGAVELRRRDAKGQTYRADSEEEIQKANYQLRAGQIGKYLHGKSQEEKLEWGLEQKTQANVAFGKGLYEQAIPMYMDALLGLDLTNNGNNECYENMIDLLQVPVLCNLAACFLHIQEYQRVARLCSEALGVRPKCVKARLRRAQAHTELGNFKSAKSDFQLLTQDHPDVSLVKYTKRLRERLAINRTQQEAHTRKMQKAFEFASVKSTVKQSTSPTAKEAGRHIEPTSAIAPGMRSDSFWTFWVVLVRNVVLNLFNGSLCRRRRSAYKFE